MNWIMRWIKAYQARRERNDWERGWLYVRDELHKDPNCLERLQGEADGALDGDSQHAFNRGARASVQHVIMMQNLRNAAGIINDADYPF